MSHKTLKCMYTCAPPPLGLLSQNLDLAKQGVKSTDILNNLNSYHLFIGAFQNKEIGCKNPVSPSDHRARDFSTRTRAIRDHCQRSKVKGQPVRLDHAVANV